jgi:tetraacyldisaccharide 4'-kinase
MKEVKGIEKAMKSPMLLFISNGYGEDTISSRIIKSMRESGCPHAIKALPLVGEGKAYVNDGVELLGPCRLMPSGGMIPGNIKNLLGDLGSGLFRLTLDQIAAIKKARSSAIMTVAVGDIYPVIMASLFSNRPLVMVGTAKSNYFYHYNGFERHMMKSSCSIVFTRDDITARVLCEKGITALWVGNAMMDSLEITGEDFGLAGDYPCVGILPGSRTDTYRDISVILGSVERLSAALSGKVTFIMALADSIEVKKLAENVPGWNFNEGAEVRSGSVIHHFTRESLLVKGVCGKFGDVLKISKIIIGQAGTGNEQAVGFGKPVVTFESSGREKMGWYRARQKGLLGDSISVVPRDSEIIAREVIAILNDEGRYSRMQAIGYERMGPPGAAGKMAARCIGLLSGKAGASVY